MGMGVHAAGTAAGWGQGLPGGPQLQPHHATTVTAPPGVQTAPPPPPPPAQMMAYPMQQFQVIIHFLSPSKRVFVASRFPKLSFLLDNALDIPRVNVVFDTRYMFSRNNFATYQFSRKIDKWRARIPGHGIHIFEHEDYQIDVEFRFASRWIRMGGFDSAIFGGKNSISAMSVRIIHVQRPLISTLLLAFAFHSGTSILQYSASAISFFLQFSLGRIIRECHTRNTWKSWRRCLELNSHFPVSPRAP